MSPGVSFSSIFNILKSNYIFIYMLITCLRDWLREMEPTLTPNAYCNFLVCLTAPDVQGFILALLVLHYCISPTSIQHQPGINGMHPFK